MTYSYTIKYGPTFDGLECGNTLYVLVYNYDGRFDAGSQS